MSQTSGESGGRSDEGPAGGVLVIIPTYNEQENLPLIVARVRASVPSAHILVADDASPDGTGQLADRIAADDDHLHVLHRPGKQGLGAAYLDGFDWGLHRGFDILVEMDADGSHRPEQLPSLLERIDAGADVVLGSRWVAGGSVLNWPRHRLLLSRGGNLYTRLVLGIAIRDATGGYRAFHRRALERLVLSDVESQGYCFQVDLAWRAVLAGMRVEEVPITFVERELGASKMSQSIVVEALWRVTQWGARRRWHQLIRSSSWSGSASGSASGSGSGSASESASRSDARSSGSASSAVNRGAPRAR